MNIKNLLNKLLQNIDLSSDEAGRLLSETIEGNVSDVQIASLFTALAMKGETVEEMVGFIQTMRNNMVKVGNGFKPFPTMVDVCGTGGDGKQTFNISTAVAFVVAGAGVSVAKHGNRAASSRCGSADVLESLGVNIILTPDQAKKVLESVGMVFLFAPTFHPAMKTVSLVRKSMGIRTVFNFLGPFCNPAGVKRQLIGVPSLSVAEKLIQVGKQLDYEHLIVATSETGLDEISIVDKTYIYELKNGSIFRFVIDPKTYGFSYTTEDLHGGSADVNAKIITDILDGQKGQKRDVVVLNSGVALYISGKAKDIDEGITLAKQAIDSGNAKSILGFLKKETNALL